MSRNDKSSGRFSRPEVKIFSPKFILLKLSSSISLKGAKNMIDKTVNINAPV